MWRQTSLRLRLGGEGRPSAESIADAQASYFSIRTTFYKLRRAVDWRDKNH